jgi:transcriptional regulator with XRE-family HTH domain
MERIGSLIREARLSRALTVAKLAERAAVSTATVSMLERGKRAAISHRYFLRKELSLYERRTARPSG